MRLVLRATASLLAAVLAGCGSGASASPTGGASPAPGSTSALASSGPVGGSPSGSANAVAGGGDPRRVKVRLDPVVGGLSAPLFATGAGDGSDRIFVVEQAGRIRIARNGALVDPAFLDISASITAGGERGLLGLAFEPGFGHSGKDAFYVDYTNAQGDTEIARFRVDGSNPDVADPGSRQVLLRIGQPFANHNGGMVAFGPDGMLYIGMGDGGSEDDPMGNGQSLGTELGKLLRIDVGSPGGGKPYSVPRDNPFVSTAGALPEIWAYGLRNPWRFSFDRASGDLWIGDVGQNLYEEIDRARTGTGGGANYGWNRMEGLHCFKPPEGCDENGLVLPIAEYGHDQGCAVVGGYVDRAPDAGGLAGVYLLADECSGRVWGLDWAGAERQEPVLLADTSRAISSFGEDDRGAIYATDLSAGELLRVTGESR